MDQAEIGRKLADIEACCELGEYLALPVRTYSAGMMTRLGFAIATTLDPDILLLDEGLAAGDARFAASAERRMKVLIDRSSILVLASHSEGMIAAMCNKALLMETGRVIAYGPTRDMIDLYHQRNTQSEAEAQTRPPLPRDLAAADPEMPAPDGNQINLVYQAIHTVSTVLPTDPQRMTPWGGSSILGYSYARKGSEEALKVRINANAYAHEDNEVALAVFRGEHSVPIEHRSQKVRAGDYAMFDFEFDLPMFDASSVNLDVRIGPAEPGSLTLNGPPGSGPPPGIPSPALTITAIERNRASAATASV